MEVHCPCVVDERGIRGFDDASRRRIVIGLPHVYADKGVLYRRTVLQLQIALPIDPVFHGLVLGPVAPYLNAVPLFLADSFEMASRYD